MLISNQSVIGQKLERLPPPHPGWLSLAEQGPPRLLFLTHDWGGGVEQHIQDLIDLCHGKARIVVMRALNDTHVTIEHTAGTLTHLSLRDWNAFLRAMSALRFNRLHLHHIHGLPAKLLDLDQELGVPLDCTLHDHWPICPQYLLQNVSHSYCGEPHEEGCNACIRERPHPWGDDILTWRRRTGEVLHRAERIFAPSQAVANTLLRYWSDLNITKMPHPERKLVWPKICKVALLGSLSPVKGLDLAIAVNEHAARHNMALNFRLIGHAATPLPTGFTATGSYSSDDLPKLIAIERPDVIWLPSQVPETYSYTLSVALASALPIVASDLGAIGERLRHHARATLLPHDASVESWLNALWQASSLSRTQRSNNEKPPPPVTSEDRTSVGDAYCRPLSDFDDTAADYLDAYLSPLPPLGEQLDSGFSESLDAATGTFISKSQDQRALLDLFRIGVFAGHLPSRQVVQQALSELPAGESHIVGRSVYEHLEIQCREFEQALSTEQAAHARNQKIWDEQRQAAEQRAKAAREHIAHLESRVRELGIQLNHSESERQMLLNSRSWRITQPLRSMTTSARELMYALQAIRRLTRRLITNFPGALMRFRRSGWRSLYERLRQELRNSQALQKAGAIPRIEVLPVIRALTLHTSDLPEISILIPVYGQDELTFACLESISRNPPKRPYEVIVRDDAHPQPVGETLREVRGVRFERGESNLGFVGNVNAASHLARGHWLVILNNDTIVCPGALDALIDTFDAHDKVGLVGAKLINQDGSLQEAGGIVWKDGSAWNWGRGERRDDPRFNFVRDADYCSGAAIAIKRELFLSLGGFDPLYTPAYYEDTDLAFRLRKMGLRVLYQPAAEIFHLEGRSHGQDECKGIKAYQAVNAKKFYERWKSLLQHHRPNGTEPELEATRNCTSRILIVEACMLTPDQDSGSVRLLNLIMLLKQDGHHVTYIADNLDGNPKYARELQAIGVEVMHGGFVSSVRKFIQQRGPYLDTIMLCRHYIASQYVDSIRTLAPKARIVFDTVDLHFLREEREAALLGNPGMATAARLTRKKELDVISRSDTTLVVSAIEKAMLAELLPEAHVELISNIHAPSVAIKPFSDRNSILFVGGFRHPPNVDAVRWYAKDILPHLRKRLPDVTTFIVGSNMPEEIRALAQPGLEIMGYVADISKLLQSVRVSIAPLRYGAGVKGKINEAMNYGTPVVATACAIEGMHLVDGVNVLVADEAELFADAIARLHQDQTLWERLTHAGRENVRMHFSMEAAAPVVRRVFRTLSSSEHPAADLLAPVT